MAEQLKITGQTSQNQQLPDHGDGRIDFMVSVLEPIYLLRESELDVPALIDCLNQLAIYAHQLALDGVSQTEIESMVNGVTKQIKNKPLPEINNAELFPFPIFNQINSGC